jgi:tetratricopeptide (TPR) repeat protein
MSLGSTYSLQVPSGSPLGTALRLAADAAKASRYEEAARHQKKALELGGAQLLPAASVVLRLTLGSYQLHVAMKANDVAVEAADTLEAVITRARALGMDWELVQAALGLATARCLLNEHEAAAGAYLTAANVAKQTGEVELAGEALRRAGDSSLMAGNRGRALARWRAALELLTDEALGDDDLDEIAVIDRLRAFYQGKGIELAAQHLDKIVDQLRTTSGAN